MSTRRRNIKCKKKHLFSSISELVRPLAMAVLIIFVINLCFVVFNKSGGKKIIPTHINHTGIGLPPKPEERWSYIKELENCQVKKQTLTGVSTSVKREMNSLAHQLTDEQRHLLRQMWADMLHHKSANLNEISHNYRSKTPVATTNQQHQTDQVLSNLCSQQPALQQNTPITTSLMKKNDTIIMTKELPKKPDHWMIQCGSFKSITKAELMHARLAFYGIENYITISDDRIHIMLGPYSGHDGVKKSLRNLCNAGVSNCVHITAGG